MNRLDLVRLGPYSELWELSFTDDCNGLTQELQSKLSQNLP